MGVTVVERDYLDCLKSPEFDIKCTTTNLIVMNNGRLVMGGGVARIMRDFYTDIDLSFGEIVSANNGKRLIQVVRGTYWNDDAYLVGFPTKIDWKNPSPINLVERSMKQLVAFVHMINAEKIILPAPGCGLGGLDFDSQVLPLLNSIDGVDERLHICVKR